MSETIFSVAGKVCLVTGASSGLGGHIARLLLENGALVSGLARTEPDWDTAAYEGAFNFAKCDVCDEEAVTATIDEMKNQNGSIEVLFNNAGVSNIEKARKMSAEGLRAIFDVNVIAAGVVARICAEQMRKTGKGGSIINMTSVMRDTSVAGLSAYSASKAALGQLTSGLASEWARDGIRVNNLSPGWFPTGMTNSYLEQGLGEVLKARIPMARLGDAHELDGACLLLASDASRYMTGTTITVDGGFSLIN